MNELQPMETDVAGQGRLFDYASLDAETRIVVRQRAGEIKSIAKRMAADVVDIGEKLGDVKQRLGANDRFNDWLSAELGWSPRTAHNFIGVWRRFGSANFAIENVAVSALYALAAPSTPIEAIEEVKQIADSGQEVTHTVAKEIIEKAKTTRPKQAELAEAVDPSTICLCGCKAGDHVRNGRYLECANCECEIFQEASAEEIVERNTVEKALGITPSKRTASGLASTPTPETIARLKAEMELEESDDREKASSEPSTEFFARPAGWFNSPIEIRITLLPGGDAETRKIQYAVRDVAIQFRAAPLTAEDYGEDTLLRLLPDAAYKLVEQLAAEWGKNQWSDAAKKRLKAEAIARWRREPVETVNLDDEEGDEGFHPGFPPAFDANRAEKGLAQEEKAEEIGLPYQEVSQADVNIMAEYYAAQEIAEGKPVRLCHFDGGLYVVTASTGSDAENWSEVEAWPVLPLASFVGDVRTYEDTQADYYAGDISDPDHVFSYERIKINCGSKKKPNWYVINGPKTVFKVNYSAEYPDDEIEAPAIEQALHSALHCVQGAAERWRPLQENGATDAELTAAIGKEFGLGGGSSQHGGYRYKGGKSPQFSWPSYADLSRAQTLKGKRLLAKVREIMEIGAPGQVQNATADDDDFTAPRCSECGRIDGAHTPECSQNPNTLAFEDYLAYAKFTKPEKPQSWARKWALTKEMDGPVQAWKLYWKELEDSGVIPFLQLCMCGHPLLKHKPEVGCEGKLGDQDCQCVTFVASAETEEPKLAEKGRAAR